MTQETLFSRFRRVRTTNATDTSFPSKIATLTAPTGAGVVDVSKNSAGPNGVIVIPFGIGDDDDVFAMRVIGWRPAGTGASELWIPVLLAELTCTMSTATGVAGGEVLATERFADTIVLVDGNDDISIDITSPEGNVIAHAVIDAKGFPKIEMTFDSTTGDPTSMNALVALI
jgi:hypothetical protein